MAGPIDLVVVPTLYHPLQIAHRPSAVIHPKCIYFSNHSGHGFV
jgi:hypothetical protein